MFYWLKQSSMRSLWMNESQAVIKDALGSVPLLWKNFQHWTYHYWLLHFLSNLISVISPTVYKTVNNLLECQLSLFKKKPRHAMLWSRQCVIDDYYFLPAGEPTFLSIKTRCVTLRGTSCHRHTTVFQLQMACWRTLSTTRGQIIRKIDSNGISALSLVPEFVPTNGIAAPRKVETELSRLHHI